MSNTPENIYLITGAARAFIYAGARDRPPALEDVASRYLGRVEIVEYVAGDRDGNVALAKKIENQHGRIDTVIANAGISNFIGKVDEAPIHEYEEHFKVNVMGPLVLFQSLYKLLKSSKLPRFITISSGSGSLEMIPRLGTLDLAPYGASKAALNWLTRKIHFENDWIISFPLTPGGVNTDMLHKLVDWGKITEEKVKQLTRTPDVAAEMLVEIIRASSREKEGGRFVTVEGKRFPW
ncbi:NAD(P)-binding protein [Pholiota conissans]|uniref:NAD(P)-binding protein n=1 Tax=Pholiota conissans TaxID=109636 RepID=A0A9P6CP84_9AGAR|nr:NAD(P)-binding protein [Pholiota conissans]